MGRTGDPICSLCEIGEDHLWLECGTPGTCRLTATQAQARENNGRPGGASPASVGDARSLPKSSRVI